MKLAVAMLLVTIAASPAWSQAPPNGAPMYVESFRKGATSVTERTASVNLDVQNPSYEIRIKDLRGEERYLLSLIPVRVGQEDPSIMAWRAELVDLHRRFYGDLLLPYRDESLNAGPKGNAAKFDPNPYAVVPLRTVRTIKVENFYCTFEVKQYHLHTPERWLLDSMTMDIRFTNTKPEIN